MATNKISHRVDTAAAWTSANPTLELGELGFESDTGNWKRGDGSTTWTSLGYATGLSAVGTVSESAGTPTGAVIERGSNANGEYVKYADGTLIMHHAVATLIDSSAKEVSWTYPITAVSVTDAFLGCFVDDTNSTGVTSTVIFNSPTTAAATFRAYGATVLVASPRVRFTFIGRWY